MRRIQIHLEEELDEALARDARARGISKAALIREYLAGHARLSVRRNDDATQRLIGSYGGGKDDSTSVDDVVYGT